MSNHGITPENLLHTLPDVLKNDEGTYALASISADALAARVDEINSIMIYTRIDELPEPLLDILAHDFKIDWWDNSLSLAEKRATLKSSWMVHRSLGTKAAVETALSAIYEGTQVIEWFEYEGVPYHFGIIIPIDQTALDLTKHAKVLSLIDYYKNQRSVLDGIQYFGTSGAATTYAVTAVVGCAAVITATAKYY